MYASKLEKNVWNLGLSVSKSKRASNEWYQSRSTKRALKLDAVKIKKTPHNLIWRAFNLCSRICNQIPNESWVVIDPHTARKSAIARYMTRVGFGMYEINGRFVWALKVPVRVVDGYRFAHSVKADY